MKANRSNRSLLNRWWLSVDRYLLSAILILMVVGGLMSITASPAVAHRIGATPWHFIRGQFLFLSLGFCIMFTISLLEPVVIRRFCVLGFIFSIISLVLVLFVGAEIKGSTRWIALGPMSFQPSEFMKPLFFVTSAWMFSEKLKNAEFPGFAIAILLYVMVITLLILEPDFGTSFMVTMVWGAMFFLAGLPMIMLAVFVVIGLFGFVAAYAALPHVAARIDKFMHPETSESYQTTKSLEALSNGGFFGRGPGEGVVKDYIPDAHTDFVFAVLGEEMGLFFALLIIGIYAFITIRGFIKISDYKDNFVVIACAAILMNFALQAIINIGVALHLMPTKGMTLPFISYGGSSMMASSISIGVLLALTRKRYEKR